MKKLNGTVSDQTSNLENRNWIDAGSSPVSVKNVCETCGTEFNGSKGFWRFCSKSCKGIYLGRKSVENRPSDWKSPFSKFSKEGGWTCPICEVNFRTRKDLFQHKKELNHYNAHQNHSPGGKCFYCDRELKQKEFLTNHEKFCPKNPNRSFRKGYKWTDEDKKRISEQRRLFLKNNPDKHP